MFAKTVGVPPGDSPEPASSSSGSELCSFSTLLPEHAAMATATRQPPARTKRRELTRRLYLFPAASGFRPTRRGPLSRRVDRDGAGRFLGRPVRAALERSHGPGALRNRRGASDPRAQARPSSRRTRDPTFVETEHRRARAWVADEVLSGKSKRAVGRLHIPDRQCRIRDLRADERLRSRPAVNSRRTLAAGQRRSDHLTALGRRSSSARVCTSHWRQRRIRRAMQKFSRRACWSTVSMLSKARCSHSSYSSVTGVRGTLHSPADPLPKRERSWQR